MENDKLESAWQFDISMTLNYFIAHVVLMVVICHFSYSTDMQTNSLTFGCLNIMDWDDKEHKLRTAWATMLYELYWHFVEVHDFQEDKYSVDLTKSNTLVLQIVVDALKLTPCDPTFVEACDVIIQTKRQLID
jgi:hypothetical protein